MFYASFMFWISFVFYAWLQIRLSFWFSVREPNILASCLSLATECLSPYFAIMIPDLSSNEPRIWFISSSKGRTLSDNGMRDLLPCWSKEPILKGVSLLSGLVLVFMRWLHCILIRLTNTEERYSLYFCWSISMMSILTIWPIFFESEYATTSYLVKKTSPTVIANIFLVKSVFPFIGIDYQITMVSKFNKNKRRKQNERIFNFIVLFYKNSWFFLWWWSLAIDFVDDMMWRRLFTKKEMVAGPSPLLVVLEHAPCAYLELPKILKSLLLKPIYRYKLVINVFLEIRMEGICIC